MALDNPQLGKNLAGLVQGDGLSPPYPPSLFFLRLIRIWEIIKIYCLLCLIIIIIFIVYRSKYSG
jgi:hypothetical protein